MRGLLITKNTTHKNLYDISYDGMMQDCLGKDEVLGFIASVLFTQQPLFCPKPVPIIEEARPMKEAVMIAEIIGLKRKLEEAEQYKAQADPIIRKEQARAKYWKGQIAIMKEALEEIKKYSEDEEGLCPYGCDCPNIAYLALMSIENDQYVTIAKAGESNDKN